MRRKGHKTTPGVKFDSTFELYLPDFLYDEKFWKLDHDFGTFRQFSTAHAQKRPLNYFQI